MSIVKTWYSDGAAICKAAMARTNFSWVRVATESSRNTINRVGDTISKLLALVPAVIAVVVVAVVVADTYVYVYQDMLVLNSQIGYIEYNYYIVPRCHPPPLPCCFCALIVHSVVSSAVAPLPAAIATEYTQVAERYHAIVPEDSNQQ